MATSLSWICCECLTIDHVDISLILIWVKINVWPKPKHWKRSIKYCQSCRTESKWSSLVKSLVQKKHPWETAAYMTEQINLSAKNNTGAWQRPEERVVFRHKYRFVLCQNLLSREGTLVRLDGIMHQSQAKYGANMTGVIYLTVCEYDSPNQFRSFKIQDCFNIHFSVCSGHTEELKNHFFPSY